MPLLLLSGEWEELDELATYTRSEGSPLERPMAVTILGHLRRYQGKSDVAWEMVREILPRGPGSEPEEALFPYATDTMRLATRLSIDAGDVEKARAWLGAHDRWLAWSGSIRGQAESAMLQSEIRRLEGDLEQAKQIAAEAVALASEPRQPVALLEAERTLGRILTECEQFDAAVAHLTRALDLARECAAPYDEALSALFLATVQKRQHGDSEATRRLLNDARERSEPLSATPLLREIERLHSDLAHTNGLAKLSGRELEVLRMVSQGLTDAEVAENLYISPRTVSQHMRSVYNKLGVSSRAAATRWAVQNDLV